MQDKSCGSSFVLQKRRPGAGWARGQLAGPVPPCRPAWAAELAPGQPRPPPPRGYVRKPAVAGRPGAAGGEAALGAGGRRPRPPASRRGASLPPGAPHGLPATRRCRGNRRLLPGGLRGLAGARALRGRARVWGSAL